tara:strand:- start:719 stop:919 length:201 start_codon:yes stop_codon:yes gene_type:complete
MNIGKSIKIACVKKDITQEALSKKIGVSTVTISTLANNKGSCKQKTLEALAEAFEMPVSEFIALGE